MTPEEKKAKAAELRAEADKLDQPEPVEYPKWLHPASGEPVLVESAEAEAAYLKALAPPKYAAPVAPADVPADEDEADGKHSKAGKKK